MAVQFPDLDDAKLIPLRAFASLYRRNPKMLEDPACPYSQTVKDFLAKTFAAPVAAQSEAPAKSQYSVDDLETEVSTLYSELKTAGLTVKVNDPKEKIALLKTSADLLTKMVGLKERLFNIKAMSAFQSTVIQLLEGLLTPDQRSEFIERLAQHVQAGSTEVLGQGDLGDPAEAEG